MIKLIHLEVQHTREDCPYLICHESTNIYFCRAEKKHLDPQPIITWEKSSWQPIPDWCSLPTKGAIVYTSIDAERRIKIK